MALTLVQGGGTSTPASATGPRTFASNVTAGNKVIILAFAYRHNHSGAFVAGDCTKTAGTATIGSVSLLAQAQSFYNGINYVQVGIWAADVTGNGSLTMTVTGSGADANEYWGVVGEEWNASGGWDGSYVENTVTNSTTNDNTNASSGNTSSAGAAAFLGVLTPASSSNPLTLTPDGAFTQVFEQEDGAAQQAGSAIYKIVGSGDTDSFDWGIGAAGGGSGSNSGWAVAGVVLKEASGGGDSLMGQFIQ
jgi:hypothetical protein